MSKLLNRSTRSLVLAALLALPLAGPSRAVFALPQPPGPVAAKVEVVRLPIPTTPEEHMAMAGEYAKKAATYRAEVAFHQKMLEDYKKTVAQGPAGKVPENPYIVNMRKHCEAYIRDAEALAVDAEKFAEFHRMRAAELQGK